MKLNDFLTEAPLPKIANFGLSDEQRHDLLEFMFHWLSGSYMDRLANDASTLQKWEQIAKMFPTGITGPKPLYRLVTLPIEMAQHKQFVLRPAPGAVSSWTSKLTGLNYVQGIAMDKTDDEHGTARIAIVAEIAAEDILATPLSMRRAVNALAHDYNDERFPMVDAKRPYIDHKGKERMVSSETYPTWPGDDDMTRMQYHDFDHMKGYLNSAGGYYRQWEHIVRTPHSLAATVKKVFRIGDNTIHSGWEI